MIHDGVSRSAERALWCDPPRTVTRRHPPPDRPPPSPAAAAWRTHTRSVPYEARPRVRACRADHTRRDVVKCTRASWHSTDTSGTQDTLDACCMTAAHIWRLHHGLRQGTLYRWEDIHLHQHRLRGQYSQYFKTHVIHSRATKSNHPPCSPMSNVHRMSQHLNQIFYAVLRLTYGQSF